MLDILFRLKTIISTFGYSTMSKEKFEYKLFVSGIPKGLWNAIYSDSILILKQTHLKHEEIVDIVCCLINSFKTYNVDNVLAIIKITISHNISINEIVYMMPKLSLVFEVKNHDIIKVISAYSKHRAFGLTDNASISLMLSSWEKGDWSS